MTTDPAGPRRQPEQSERDAALAHLRGMLERLGPRIAQRKQEREKRRRG